MAIAAKLRACVNRLSEAIAVAAALGMVGAVVADQLPASSAAAGGTFTTLEQGAGAYSISAAVEDQDLAGRAANGRSKFNEAWVLPTEYTGVWGVGPTFNEASCPACHRNNGRAKAPEHGGEVAQGLLLRLSVAGQAEHGAPAPHPVYGDQLQNRGIANRVPEEGKAFVTYGVREVSFADGEKVSLRVPRIELRDLRFGELGQDTMLSPRIAGALIGLGLLEAVPESSILALAQAQQQLGVSGKPNYVWDVEAGKVALGRFGWKAGQPNLRQQTAAALINDHGATSSIFPRENCPPAQSACITDPAANTCGSADGCKGAFVPEVLPSRLTNITLYVQTLAVPARRSLDDEGVRRGEALFAQANCGACHTPELKTGSAAPIAAAANQVIRPYTDLLLHDMGEELADARPEFQADGREWRTAPLWGVGLQAQVGGHTDLLHDGRARNVSEAILWHGGEAQSAREAYRNMAKPDRAALVKFVESL